MREIDKLEQIYIMMMAELKCIDSKEYIEAINIGKLNAYRNVLSCMGFSDDAIVRIYSEFGFDWSFILEENKNI